MDQADAAPRLETAEGDPLDNADDHLVGAVRGACAGEVVGCGAAAWATISARCTG
jgi:hypothetical protein